MDLDCVIRGGMIVNASDQFAADIGIKESIIAGFGLGLQAERVIHAKGKLVLPGAVDPHVHLEMPAGATTSSDHWETGTVAAGYGGTTAVIGFVEPRPEE